MNLVKKLLTAVIALVMMLGMSIRAMAEDPSEGDTPDTPIAVPVPGTGTITVNNAGIGETYKIYKVLDAKVGANGAIVYTGEIPEGLEDFFEENDAGEISLADGVTEAQLFAALKTWAATQQPSGSKTAETATVKFDNLPFGYYVVTSSMNNGAVVSVTSTAPDAVTYEKNVTVPQPEKVADDEDKSYSIGDTIIYTVTFNGANYMIPEGEDGNPDPANAKIVTSYDVSDTLPNFLSNAHVVSITIGEGADAVELEDIDFVNKKFNIPWATYDGEKWTSKYPNGTLVTIVYEATLTDVVRVGEDNTNTVTIQPNVGTDDGDEEPWDETWEDEETVTTYATAIKKVDEDGKPLAGAKFKIQGLTAVQTAPGVYTVTKYDPQTITLDDSTELVVNLDGMLYIIGLEDELELSLTETEAPAGYNRLTTSQTITSQVQSKETIKTSGYRKYDSKGNIIEESEETIEGGEEVVANLEDLYADAIQIENNKGTELPSTGGMGTTIFYTLGGMLVLCAGILLVSRRRMSE